MPGVFAWGASRSTEHDRFLQIIGGLTMIENNRSIDDLGAVSGYVAPMSEISKKSNAKEIDNAFVL